MCTLINVAFGQGYFGSHLTWCGRARWICSIWIFV